MLHPPRLGLPGLLGQRPAVARPLAAQQGQQHRAQPGPHLRPGHVLTDAFQQLIDVAAPGGGSYSVPRGHRRGVRSPHTFDAARWPPSSLTSPYVPQRSTTAVLSDTPGSTGAEGRAEEADRPTGIASAGRVLISCGTLLRSRTVRTASCRPRIFILSPPHL